MAAPENNSGLDAATYCANLVRENDIDRYLSTLFLPENIRSDAFALYAFDAEISHIRVMIKEPMMGEIRLQWWRDILGGDRRGEAAINPVASELMRVITAHDLPIMGFDNYLKARSFDFYNDPMPDTGTFEGYAGETASFLFYQLATILSNKSDVVARNLADCAGHAGVAWTMLNVLKQLPLHRARHQSFVPADILSEAGISSEALYSAEDRPLMIALVEKLVLYARQHHLEYKNQVASLPPEVKLAFLPMCLLSPYLARNEKLAGIAVSTPVDISQWRKQIYIWRAARNGKY